MYEIVIDVSKIALLDNPRDFILQIPTKIFSSTNPPISPDVPHIGYKVILQNSKADDALNPNSIKEVLTKLQTRFEELMKANYSDAGYQQIRDAQKKTETINTTHPQFPDTQPQPPSPIPTISPQVPHAQIQKNAPNPHPSSNQSSNKISNLPTSIFSKNSANPSSNPFISGSAGGANSFFNNPSSSSNSLRPNSSGQQGQNQNRQQQNSMNIFGNSVNFAQSGQLPSNIGAGMYSQQNNQSSGQLFTDPHRSTTQRSTASRQKRHNLA